MQMPTNGATALKLDLGSGRAKIATDGQWMALKRGIAIAVAFVLAALILSSTFPSLVADQSDRAVVNAPVTLLTAPITGEVTSLAAVPGTILNARSRVAEVVNSRVDRSTLIELEGKQSGAVENLQAVRSKKISDVHYVFLLTQEIDQQTAIVVARYQQQIVDLQAQVGSAGATTEEKKQIVGREAEMVAHSVVAPSMTKAATQQYAAARFQQESIQSKLMQKQAQLESATKGIFVGDDVHDLAALIQKKRDMQLDIQRLDIEETQIAASVESGAKFLVAEQARLASLERSTVEASSPGEILHVGAAVGRHVTAGDTLARMVDCNASFVVAIFSYREGSDLRVGGRVSIDAGSAGTRDGMITEVLPKTSDKVDETYAVPFPQTERRELYVLVKPDNPFQSVVTEDGHTQCDIGRWVTVTRANGWIPSTSVLWRGVASLLRGRSDTSLEKQRTAWAAMDRAVSPRGGDIGNHAAIAPGN